MLAKRIIPCLDVRHGKVVKGVNFLDVKDVGDPVELAREYNRQGADELVFYDIVASHEGRGAILEVIRRTAENVFIPFCVGGGVSSVDDFKAILRAGADKVSVNSAAVKNPSLIGEAADIFGSQCVVLGIDTKRSPDTKSGYTVCINGGRIDTGRDLLEWAAEAERRGAGEICLNSMDNDGVRGGFDIPMLKAICETVKIPVIASGGAGKVTDFGDAFEKTGCSAALAASLFHFGELTIADVKENCRLRGIDMR